MSDFHIDHESVPSFTYYADLACEKFGGLVVFATDDWFAQAENMLKQEEAVFKDGLFTNYGKWMDGWETRRKRTPGHDWCIIQLECIGIIKGFEVSTRYFTGNFPPAISIQGACLNKMLSARRSSDRMGSAATIDELKEVGKLNSQDWEELVPQTKLRPGYETTHTSYFKPNAERNITHIRLNLYPDGGVARFRVFGEVTPDFSKINTNVLLDLASMLQGGICVEYSCSHYGHARNVIAPGRASKMDEGWETARRTDRPPLLTESILSTHGGEWAMYKLGHLGVPRKVEIDTNHFKGNYPYSIQLLGCKMGDTNYHVVPEEVLEKADWHMIIDSAKLGPHRIHNFDGETGVLDAGPVDYIKLAIYPDGGISRMKVWCELVHSK